jgi:hypothetical protein
VCADTLSSLTDPRSVRTHQHADATADESVHTCGLRTDIAHTLSCGVMCVMCVCVACTDGVTHLEEADGRVVRGERLHDRWAHAFRIAPNERARVAGRHTGLHVVPRVEAVGRVGGGDGPAISEEPIVEGGVSGRVPGGELGAGGFVRVREAKQVTDLVRGGRFKVETLPTDLWEVAITSNDGCARGEGGGGSGRG